MEGQQDLVFCHECENEWFRHQGGLTCPDCHSDFTEILFVRQTPLADSDHQIEAQHDPRHVEPDEPEAHPFDNHNPWAHTPLDAPDPDESDLSGETPAYQMRTNTNPNGGISMSFSRTFTSSPNPRGPASPPPHTHNHAQGPDALLQMLSQIIGGARQPNQTTRDATPQSPDGEPNVRVFTGGGPNFQYTATARLSPRDANAPQANLPSIDNLPNLLDLFQPPPRGAGPDPAFPPIGFGFGNILNNLFNPANMQHGDAVYSQEALDRIISQLMDQQQSNAPGPASTEAIAALPQREIAKEDLDDTGKAACSICMEEALIGSQVTYLPCSHWFHGDCVKAWLAEHDTCPHCRQGITPGERGTRDDPINVSESPDRPTNTTSAWARMRDAFGGGT
ncbi:hypothetical protein E4T39_02442 [Aureobasidium subglaciale]|nr:hypothetical protein E4T39_02442 [Aureobasidium subglaciale]